MVDKNKLKEVMDDLLLIDQDLSVPKNVRVRIKKAISILSNDEEKNINIKIDRSLQELGDVAEDPNLPQYTRMQIWSVVSQLESK